MELTTGSGRRIRWTTLLYGLDDRYDAWSHSGAAITADGRLVLAQRGGAGITLIDLAGGSVEQIATPTADCHGILSVPSIDPGTLWIADPGGQVIALDLATRGTRRIRQPGRASENDVEHWAPTSVAFVTTGAHRGDLWIADPSADVRHGNAPLDSILKRVTLSVRGSARLGVKPCAVRGYEENWSYGITSRHDHLIMPPEGFQAADGPMLVAR